MLFTLIILFSLGNIFAQITDINPPFPKADQAMTIVFDATLGSGGLADYSGDVYAHTGVITDKSTSSIDWRYVKTDWGENTPETRLTKISENKYQLTIGPSIRDYYEVPSGEVIQSVAFVFRSDKAVGGQYLEGKTEDFGDIFVEVFNENSEFLFRITKPTRSNIIIDEGEAFAFEGFTSQPADLKLYDNDMLIAQNPSGTELRDSITATTEGNHDLVFQATDTAGNIYRDSIRYIVPGFPPIAGLPGEIKLGTHPVGDDSLRFILEAPGKKEVWIIGSFTNWQLDTENFQMNRTPGGKYFWLDVGPLDQDSSYTYQYLVDRNIYIADPLSEVVLDPVQDNFIGENWPGLPTYPEQAKGIVTYIPMSGFGYEFKHQVNSPDKEELVIYELLIRDFLNDHSYNSLIDTLDYLEKLGVNTIELMPVQEFEGNISWGYNPSFHGAVDKYYGRPDTLKAFIDEAHKRNMLVLLDVVYNHAFSQSPLCQLYWDNDLFRPSPDNPWLNEEARHPFNVGYDFNHDYEGTQRYVKTTLRRWLEEYKFDGFRFDLSKGFTQRKTNDVGVWGAYDANRIATLKDYGNFIWQIHPEAIVILEHFGENREEKELAEHGFLLWNNMSHQYNEATMGYHSFGKSDISGTYYKDKGWELPHLVSYMESHDEERLMYNNLEFGNSNGSYNVKNPETALDRVEAATVFFYAIPGPKMLWQFGELGYDHSINRCTDGTVNPNCRLSPKPIRWDYLGQPHRRDLLRVTTDMIHLKTKKKLFDTSKNAVMDVNNAVKRMRIGDDIVILGNFDVEENEVSIDLLQGGKWYEFFSGDSINIQGLTYTDTLSAGEYRMYLKEKIERPSNILLIAPQYLVDNDIGIYPNPGKNEVTISFSGPLQNENKWIYVISMEGKLIWKQRSERGVNKLSIPVYQFENGFYSVFVEGSKHRGLKKLIKIDE